LTLKLKEVLARAFITTQSFKSNPAGFKLASGMISPYYVDCRVLMAHPGPRHLVAQLVVEAIHLLGIDSIGGLEIGAIPIATAVSDHGFSEVPRKEWRTFVVRKQPKDHGLGKLIEGAFQPGDQALIVDDVLTSGGSVLKAITAVREAGMRVAHALVIVDREEQDGRARVEAQGAQLISLLTIKDLLAVPRNL
jgi:orotate phosphoribosyltransferase